MQTLYALLFILLQSSVSFGAAAAAEVDTTSKDSPKMRTILSEQRAFEESAQKIFDTRQELLRTNFISYDDGMKTPPVSILMGEDRSPEILIKDIHAPRSIMRMMVYYISRMINLSDIVPQSGFIKGEDGGRLYAETFVGVFGMTPGETGEAMELARKYNQKGTLTLAMLPYSDYPKDLIYLMLKHQNEHYYYP